MGTCPFCQSSIDGDILLYGGSCPKCFGEIPGEEAATDPGEEVKARQQRSDSRRVLVRTLIPLVMAVPVVGGMLLLAVGFVIWNRNPTVEVMEFPEDVAFIGEIVEAPPEADADPDQVKPRPGPRPTPKNPRPRNDPNDGIADAGDPTKLPEVEVPRASGNNGGLNFGGVGIQVDRGGEALSDPGQIFEMIRKQMAKQQGSLKQCYDKSLKTKPDLQGRWRAYFTVDKGGRASNVRFKGSNMSDADLERCLASTVTKWKFARISRPQPVEKSWRFNPN